MKFLSAITLVAGAAGGFLGARRLMTREDLPERVPERVRPGIEAVRRRLLLARQRASTVVDEFERGRASAESELLRDYYSRVGRPVPPEGPASRTTGT